MGFDVWRREQYLCYSSGITTLSKRSSCHWWEASTASGLWLACSQNYQCGPLVKAWAKEQWATTALHLPFFCCDHPHCLTSCSSPFIDNKHLCLYSKQCYSVFIYSDKRTETFNWIIFEWLIAQTAVGLFLFHSLKDKGACPLLLSFSCLRTFACTQVVPVTLLSN